MEFMDVYDENRNLTGRIRPRGQGWLPGEYGLIVCAWVYNSRAQVLLTLRAQEKTWGLTWENSGGAAQAGEDSLTAITREVWEETGIRRSPRDFVLLRTERDGAFHLVHYALHGDAPIGDIRLLAGATADAKWVTLEEAEAMVRRGEICDIIGREVFAQEPMLRKLMEQAAPETE